MTYPILQDQVAIITGAAMGMGAATAQLFAEAGAKVVVADMNEDKGRDVAAGIEAAGGTAFFQRVDISDSEQVKAMVDATVERYGRLDAAVNNAALTPDDQPLAEFDEAYWDKLMSIDLKGTALCMKWELQQMIRQGSGGSIINISSVSGFRPQPNNAAYVAAKHGVNGLTKVAALENGALNIRVNAVAPGAIDTPMLRGALEQFNLTEEDYAPSSASSTASGSPARSPRQACGSPRTCRPTSPAPSSTSTPATRAADLHRFHGSSAPGGRPRGHVRWRSRPSRIRSRPKPNSSA